MKKIITVLFVLIACYLHAQTSCENASPFCASGVSGVTFPATTSITAAQTGPNYGCLGSTPNPAWYYLQISSTGSLDILIQGQATNPPGPGQDVDFICWGPFNSLANICNSLTAGNTIDCSYSGSFTETLNIPNGVAGQYYMVLITNFANVQQEIIFTQFNGNGTTNCALLSSNSKICAGSSGTIVATNTGSLTNPTYSLNPGNLTSTTGSFVVTPTITTSYTVYIAGINNVSVAITQTALSTVTVEPQPAAAPTVTNTTCTNTLNAFNLGLTFFPASPVPNYTVSWASIPNGVLSPTQTSLGGVSIPSGSYNATITAAGGCSTTVAFTLNPIPEPAIISISPLGSTYSVTCFQPTVTLTSLVATNNYTWTNNLIAPKIGTLAEFTSTTTGNWTIFAVNPTSSCTASQTFTIGLNVTTPSAAITPSFQNITCTLTSITTVTAIASPSVNVSNIILSPQGGSFSAQSYTTVYTPGGVGIFTHCAVNDVNGCKTCNTFTVTSNQGFPTYSVLSADNFTLGCGSKSVANISIVNANSSPAGGPVSYTLIGPPTSTITPSGVLSGIAVYSVNVPGTWTVITKDNTSFCETRTPISILSNTLSPNISASVPRLVLDCYVPKITLKGQSTTGNINYLWSFPGNPGTLQGDTITVNSIPIALTSSVIANYTLTITDNSSTCKSFTVVPMRQNLYVPHAVISNGGTSALSCKTSTIILTNQSSTSIPPATGYPSGNPVIGYLWDGPTPQEQGQVQTTYIAATTGIYTLTAKDLNNGCISTATTLIADDRIYPNLNKPHAPPPFILDCGSGTVKIFPIITNVSPGFTYTWITNGAITGEAHSATLTTSAPGSYKILTTNTINGCSSSGEVSVISGTLDGAFETDLLSGYAPLHVNFTNTSASSLNDTGINAYWNFGNGTTSTSDTASVVYSLPGTYTVTLFVNKGSCLDTVVKYIDVEIPSVIIVPNVFTPNGDGANDLFFLKASNLDEITILIYDRWGHKVYDLTSHSGNIAWDGKTPAGKDAAEGTYFYFIKAMGKDGQLYDKKGTISLYR